MNDGYNIVYGLYNRLADMITSSVTEKECTISLDVRKNPLYMLVIYKNI